MPPEQLDAGREQEHLRERSRAYDLILDHVPALIAYVDDRGCYRFANDRYCRLLRLSSEEIVGRTIRDVLGTTVLERIRPHVEAALLGEEQRFETLIETPEGEQRWVEANYVPDRAPDGSVRGFFSFILDIHERRLLEQSRAHLQYAVDHSMEGFALHDEDGRFTYVNSAQARMYGYEVEEILGKTWELLYDPVAVAEIQSAHFPVLQSEGHWRGELLGLRKDGSRFDVEVALTLLRDARGEASGIVCNCRDITQRKLAEESLHQLHKMDALGQLTGGVAHDFNNLLSVIIGELELGIDELPGDSRVRANVQRSLRAGERAAALTQRLLAFSRKQSLNPGVTDVGELVRGMDDLLRRTLGEEIEIGVVAAEDLWRSEIDASQLENALLNLAINARDAMPGGGELTITASNVSLDDGDPAVGEAASGDYVRLEVRDTGVGIPPEVLSHVYEPFFTTKDIGEGSGLGLSMVYGFALQSGGAVSIESEVGRGTVFRLDLPRAAAREASGMDEGGPSSPRAESGTILVVEDDEGVRSMVVSLLQRLGYRVVSAADAAEGLERLAEQPVDLLLSDVVLPGGASGPDLAREAARSYPDLKILFMSGHTERAIAHYGAAGFDVPLVQKPFRRRELAQRVREALGTLSEAPRS